MKSIFKLLLVTSLALSSSCAFFNSKTVDVDIASNPQGADIFIEGRNYGKTPATINIEPKPYTVVLTKEGYGATNLKLETWGAIRTNIDGSSTGDGKRCLLDMMSLIFSFNAYTSKCADFKQKQYLVNIPYLGGNARQYDYNPYSGGNPYSGQNKQPNYQNPQSAAPSTPTGKITPEMIMKNYQEDMQKYGGGYDLDEGSMKGQPSRGGYGR